MKSTRVLTAALLLGGGAALFAAAPAYAANVPTDPPAGAPTQKCAELDSGKSTDGAYGEDELITAPEGYVITMFCVKSGSENQEDGGPEYYLVQPPTNSVTIAHSTGKDISHFSFSYEKVTTPPVTTPPVTTPPHTTPVETTPVKTTPAGGGDGEGKELAETGFDNGWLLFAGLGAIALGGAIAGPRIAAAKRR
ncbi:hypothetical protein [Agromyces sp. ZXT2-6]|uniref:hypothetical protein n=1 Tax=Agromyces sp. ZXT2-6 TaxID=3461153 RepID=UPI004054E3D4